MPFEPLRPLLLSPKPMILPPVRRRRAHPRFERERLRARLPVAATRPGPCPVLDVPGKFVAASASLSNAPAMLPACSPLFSDLVVRAGPVVRSGAARLAHAPLPVRIVGQHARGVGRRRGRGAGRDRGGDRRADERCCRTGRSRGSGRSGSSPVARSRRRSPAAAGSTTFVLGLERVVRTVEVAVGRAAEHLDRQPLVVAVPCRRPADPHRSRPQRRHGRRELGEALDRVDRSARSRASRTARVLAGSCRSRAGTRRRAPCSCRWFDAPRRLALTGVRAAASASAASAAAARPACRRTTPDARRAERVRQRRRAVLVDRHRALELVRVVLRVPVEHPPVVRVPDRVEHVAARPRCRSCRPDHRRPSRARRSPGRRRTRLRSSRSRRRRSRPNRCRTPSRRRSSATRSPRSSPWFWMTVFAAHGCSAPVTPSSEPMPSCCDPLSVSNLPPTMTRPVPGWYTIECDLVVRGGRPGQQRPRRGVGGRETRPCDEPGRARVPRS